MSGKNEGELKDSDMKEKQISFTSQGVNLEGLMCEGDGRKGLVATHPHPLYGGAMHNNVVEAVVRAYAEKGYTTLRFNFRGVGRSQGSYDQGMGEQADVQGAAGYLARLGNTEIDLCGYSFGAWVNARCIENLSRVQRMIMISPPVNFMDFSFFRNCPKLRLVIAGSQDDIARATAIQQMLPKWNPGASFHVIQGADHFYRGHTAEIERIIRDWMYHLNN